MNTPVFGITGWKNSGKTTLTERLVAHLVALGLRVSTVKHAHHAFDIDKAGTDSFRHRAAGASEVAIVSGQRFAIMHELREEPEPELTEILARLAPCDLVLIEGYKRENHPKIEVRRLGARSVEPLAPNDPSILAIAADSPQNAGNLPVFGLDDIAGIAAFILSTTGLDRRRD
ncbi:MAG: molybdopterin-guanine dinucleotide biosynthesis protein B [Rhizobiaceae bacterium]|nr:molybdopterin-guanine dinucleotide biosynthesis protein B [Rhizobiaceae bacterium]